MTQSKRKWRRLVATTAAVASSCQAFVAKGPLHVSRSTSALAVSTLNDATMFLNSANSLKIPSSHRYGGSPSSNEEANGLIGFDTEAYFQQYEKSEFANPIKNHVASSIWRRQESSLLPAWFPWLPTKSQIEMLKKTELQAACEERSLAKFGNKPQLRERLWEWTCLQHQKRVSEARGGASALGTAVDMGLGLQTKYSKTVDPPKTKNRIQSRAKQERSPELGDQKMPKPSQKVTQQKSRKSNENSPESLEDWARNLDLEPLLNRRRAIHKEAKEGKKKPNVEEPEAPQNKESIRTALEAPPSLYSNLEVKQMYAAVKKADKMGDRVACRSLLLKLMEATPHDARLFRRLARLESEEGRLVESRKCLQRGLRLHPNNGFLWMGLGQLELKAQKNHEAKRCFLKAIESDPSLPHPYHALGTLEHSKGRIASATKYLKEGIRYCPTNHRLHHALGDLYREAKMLDLAEVSYRRSLKYGSAVNHGFAFNSLAYVAYEKGFVDECRYWLQQAVKLNDGRNSRSWIAWGQMEEAEGNIDQARVVYVEAIAQYETGLIKRSRKGKFGKRDSDSSKSSSPDLKLLKQVPWYRSGDKFVNVYRNWARLEERYGDEKAVNAVYTRASTAFPRNNQLILKWAEYHANQGRLQQARPKYELACRKAANWHADPYRKYAEFEMAHGNYLKARSIFYRAAQAMSLSSDGGLGNHRGGMPQLYHSWAVCEWYLDNLARAEVLFDHALRLTEDGHEGSEMRSYILYSIARLELFRGEFELAQHCVALCIKENVMPGGNSKTWELWADIAIAMKSEKLARECLKQAEIIQKDEENGRLDSLSRLLRPGTTSASPKPAAMQHLMRRDPWNHRIFGESSNLKDDFERVPLPDTPHHQPENTDLLRSEL